MRNRAPCYEKATAYGTGGRTSDARAMRTGGHIKPAPQSANGAAKMAYAEARLRATDEARSAELAADERTQTPDDDERDFARVSGSTTLRFSGTYPVMYTPINTRADDLMAELWERACWEAA